MSKKEKTRDKVLASAWELFLLQGYDHTSTREIAVAANVAVGTVFRTRFGFVRIDICCWVSTGVKYADAIDSNEGNN